MLDHLYQLYAHYITSFKVFFYQQLSPCFRCFSSSFQFFFSGFSFLIFLFVRMIVQGREMLESAKGFRFFFLMLNRYFGDVSPFIFMLFHLSYLWLVNWYG